MSVRPACVRRRLGGLWLGTLLVLPAAQAHLMVAQSGTLNLVGDGAYLVLSLPISALAGVDDDGDGRLSLAELRAHQRDIEAAVRRGVQLSDDAGPRPLQGLMLSLAAPDDAPTAPASQLVVLGRYPLAAPQRPLRLSLQLYGRGADEREFGFTVTRGLERQTLRLAPEQPQHDLLPTPWAVIGRAWAAGMAAISGLTTPARAAPGAGVRTGSAR